MRAHPDRGARTLSSKAGAAFQSASSNGPARPVGTEDAAIVQFETDGGAIGSTVISQISAGRKNRLFLELDGNNETLAFNQEEPESLWVGRRDAATLIKRDPAYLSAAAQHYATLPAGHPQGYADCFDAFVAEVYQIVASGEPVVGMPLFADGLRTARITDAVLISARERRWIDVSIEAAGGRG